MIPRKNIRAAVDWQWRSGLAAELFAVVLATVSLASCLGFAGTPPSNSGGPSGTPTITVSVSPKSASVQSGSSQLFSTTVTGTSNTSVTWSATGGTISAGGVYTAGSATGTYSVTATSVADGSKSDQATVTVSAAQAPPPPPPPGTAASITKDGITWTFSQAVPVGQFVNGDYYVVGPVTVTAI